MKRGDEKLGIEGCGHQAETGADPRRSFPVYKGQVCFRCICLSNKLYRSHFAFALGDGFAVHDAVEIDIRDQMRWSTF